MVVVVGIFQMLLGLAAKAVAVLVAQVQMAHQEPPILVEVAVGMVSVLVVLAEPADQVL